MPMKPRPVFAILAAAAQPRQTGTQHQNTAIPQHRKDNVITLYGINNCDTVKKARRWLEQQSIEFRFHDFRKDGLEAQQLRNWLTELGWEILINKRSTSWKALDDASKAALNNDTAVDLILQTPTLIKRPLLDTGNTRQVGFKAADYQKIFT